MKHLQVVLIAVSLVAISACGESTATGRVLIIEHLDRLEGQELQERSLGIEAFRRALNSGGHVAISFDEILENDPLANNYIVGRQVTINDEAGLEWFPLGALINYVVDRGWRFHSYDGSASFFVRK